MDLGMKQRFACKKKADLPYTRGSSLIKHALGQRKLEEPLRSSR